MSKKERTQSRPRDTFTSKAMSISLLKYRIQFPSWTPQYRNFRWAPLRTEFPEKMEFLGILKNS